MEGLYILVGFLLWVWGIIIGWRAREVHAKQQVEKMLEETLDEPEMKVHDEQIQIKIEKDESGFFVYDLNTSEFMAQGKTRSQVEMALAKRYPGKQFAATPTNLREIGFTL
jgi:hypothetical protein